MESWYVEQPQPTLNSGLENDEWDTYIIDAFDEALTETKLGEPVKFCKGQFDGETGLFEIEFETEGVVQDKSPDAYTRGWQREILTRMSDRVDQYKYIKYTDNGTGVEQIYLIETMPSSNGIYTKAVIHECNYTLKWQDKQTGKVYYYPTYTADATQYNTGVENAGNVIQTGYIQLMSWISADEVTIELQRDIRMFIDLSKTKPGTYIITSLSKVSYSYNEMRMMRITFTECEYNPDTDRIDLMLCNYVDPDKIPQPTTPILISYSGSSQLRIGGRKTFTAETGANDLVFSLVVPSLGEGKITMTQTDNKCVIKCVNDSALVGLSFKIIATGGGQRSELLVDIIGAV